MYDVRLSEHKILIYKTAAAFPHEEQTSLHLGCKVLLVPRQI
jgi:hypothetical protein